MSYAIPQEEPLKASIFGGQSQADNENNPSASYNKTGDTGTINAGGARFIIRRARIIFIVSL